MRVHSERTYPVLVFNSSTVAAATKITTGATCGDAFSLPAVEEEHGSESGSNSDEESTVSTQGKHAPITSSIVFYRPDVALMQTER